MYSYFSGYANGKQSPTENSCRSFRWSSSNKDEVEQDLKGEVHVVDLPPENSNKEEPHPEEQLRDLNNDQRVEANNNKGESSVEVPAENVGDQIDDQSDGQSCHQGRNYTDGPPAEGAGADGRDENLSQDRSGVRSLQGRGIQRMASLPQDLPQKDEHSYVKVNRSVSLFNQLQPSGRQRKLHLGNGQFCCQV